MKDANKSGTSSAVVAKAEKALQQYDFMVWLDSFVQAREGRNNLPARIEEPANNNSLDSEYVPVDEDYSNMYNSQANESDIVQDHQNTEVFDMHVSTPQQPADNPEQNGGKLSSKSEDEIRVNKKRTGVRGAARDALLDDLEFSLINKMNNHMDKREKRRVTKDHKSDDNEEVFCKSLALDLKELPLYEKYLAKQEMRNVIFKYQMAVMSKNHPSVSPVQHPFLNQPTSYNQSLSSFQSENNYPASGSSNFSSPPTTPNCWSGN